MGLGEEGGQRPLSHSRSRGCSTVVSVIRYPVRSPAGLAGAPAGTARNTRSFLYMCIYVESEMAVFDL